MSKNIFLFKFLYHLYHIRGNETTVDFSLGNSKRKKFHMLAHPSGWALSLTRPNPLSIRLQVKGIRYITLIF